MKLAAINSTVKGRTGAAIVERALLGVVTLLTSVILGRWGGPAELGLFAIFFPLVFIAIALQESLVIVPYMVYAHAHADGEGRRRYLGSILTHAAILGIVVAGLFFGGAAISAAVGRWDYATAALVLAAACPCVLLREFARRIVYAARKPGVAVVISGGVGTLQLIGMAALYATGRLTASSSFAVMGASSLAGGGLWLVLNRRQFQLRGAAVRESFRQNWDIGGWSVGTQVSEIAAQHMFPWLLTIAMSESAAGVYAACAMIASLLLPLHHAASNVLVPELVHARAQGGARAVQGVVRTATAALSGVMGLYCLGLAVLSSWVLAWVYGDRFAGVEGAAHAIVLLAVGQLLAGASLPAARALVALERPQAVFAAQLAGIVANIGIGIPLIAAWGIAGAAYASLAGGAIRAVVIAWRYVEAVKRPESHGGHAPAAMELATEGIS